MLGALGLAYSRAGNRQQALSLFQQAQKADKDNYDSSKWQSLIKTTRYWLAIDAGDKALKANNLPLAQQQYQQARQIDNGDSDALIGLGDVAVARKDDAAAERYYQQALRLDPASGSAMRGLVNIYQRQSPQKRWPTLMVCLVGNRTSYAAPSTGCNWICSNSRPTNWLSASSGQRRRKSTGRRTRRILMTSG